MLVEIRYILGEIFNVEVKLINYVGSIKGHEEQSCVLSLSKVSQNGQNILTKLFNRKG